MLKRGSRRSAWSRLGSLRNLALKILDLTFGWLLVAGSVLHAAGSVAAYKGVPMLLLWSLSGTLAGLLLASLNLLRAGRPGDHVLAWVSFAGCLGWIAVALGFGAVSGNILDVRAPTHAINAVVLAAMSLRAAVGQQSLNLSR